MESRFRRPTAIPSEDIHKFLTDPKERVWKGPFTFVQAADPQFGMIGSYKMHVDEPCWDKEVQLATQAIDQVNKMHPKPKFMAVCGDMLDAYPFEEAPHYYKNATESDIVLREHQYESFAKVFQNLDPDIKLICCVGNHDVGDIPTKESMQMYYKQFGTDHFAFWVGGIKFVVLNSQLFYSPESLPKEFEEQYKFIDTIKDPKAKFIVVFQHIPFFKKDPYEEDHYTNIGQKVRLPLLDKLVDAGVKYIFCGHVHENYDVMYKGLEIVVTSALGAPMGTTPSGYRIVHVSETGLKHTYINLRDSTEFTENGKGVSKICSCCSKCSVVYIRSCRRLKLFST